jgi:hypothetical protein
MLALAAAILLAAAQADGAPVSRQPLHFRIEVGLDPVKEIRGFLDESKGTGTGYDVALFDLDGDGVPESRGTDSVRIHFGEGRIEERWRPELRFEHGGADWWVWIATDHRPPRAREDGAAVVGFSWAASTDGGFAHFINGEFRAYPDAKAASAADPIRIGRPLHWVLGSKKWGPRAVVTAALSDSNGAWLRIADREDEQVRAAVRILGTGKALVGEYG